MRRLSQESGIAAVFVGVTLIAILGMFALVLDMGRIYQERRELQSGADAAVLAVAEDCGLGVLPCDDPTAANTSQIYADRNASDTAAGVYDVDLDIGAQTIEVVTSTVQASNGSTILQPLAAQVVGFTGFEVAARAKAAWGAPKSVVALPLIISDCEYDKYLPLLERPDGGVWPPGTPEAMLTFHAANDTDDCNNHPGHDVDGDGKLPGGFGWLDTDGGCEFEIQTDTWVSASPGSPPSHGCSASFFHDNVYQNYVKIPYFKDVDGVQGHGATGEYFIVDFGVLYVTGYNFGGQFKEPAGSPPCGGPIRCITG